VPKKFSNDSNGKKAEWLERLEKVLQKTMKEQEAGTLSKRKQRDPMYALQTLAPYADDASFFTREQFHSEGAFGKRTSFLLIGQMRDSAIASGDDTFAEVYDDGGEPVWELPAAHAQGSNSSL